MESRGQREEYSRSDLNKRIQGRTLNMFSHMGNHGDGGRVTEFQGGNSRKSWEYSANKC